jgi:hypothetical protein
MFCDVCIFDNKWGKPQLVLDALKLRERRKLGISISEIADRFN